jgi:hypothetical protein
MIYDVAIIRVEGTFAGMRKLMSKCDHSGVAVDYVEAFRVIWDRPRKLRVVATDFKVYFHYRKEDAKSVKECREKYDRKTRYHYRSGYGS